MRLFFTYSLLLVCSYLTTNGQTTTITLSTGSDWTDATVIKSLKSIESAMANTNYNSYPRLAATAWNHSSSLATYRNLLKFDLTSIPVGTTVQSAQLQLFSDPANTSGEFSNSGSNSFYIQKVTQAWTPTTVTWNNQPASTTTGRVTVGSSASATENINVNITALVQDMVNNPATNYGLLLRLATESASRSRSYASSNHTNSALHPKLVITLATPPSISTAWQTAIDAVFQHVNRTPVTTGFLADYGIYMTNLEKFNGIPNDSNYLEYGEWQALYNTLLSCRFNANGVFTEPGIVYDQFDNLATQNPGQHMLIGLHYRYERFSDNAVSSNLVSVSNSKIYDTPNRPQSPYEVRDAFAVVPRLSVLQGASHAFLFKPELFYTNSGKIISSIQFDAGDDLGLQPLAFNTARSVVYGANGEKILRFKITYTDNTMLESRTKVLVENIPHQNPVARSASHIDEFLFTATRTFKGPDESTAKAGKATITISYDSSDKVLRKPFIVVEGFDPWRILQPFISAMPPGSSIFGYSYEELKEGVNYSFKDFMEGDGKGNLGMARRIDYTLGNQFYTTVGEAIEKEGFDIVFVDFETGTDYMERNAYMVADLIAWVNAHKQPLNGVMQKNVVMGASMGGMVARYALREMELTSGTASHDTRLYISFDSGHQGVNLPLGLQGMISHMSGKGISLNLAGSFTKPLTFGQLKPDLGNMYKLLNSPAAKQMLIYSIVGQGDAVVHSNEIHDAFYKKYSDMGWPILGNIRNVAMASGSECGTNQGFQPLAEFANSDQGMLNFWKNLGLSILSPLAIFTNYPQAAASILPGNTNLKMKVIINALPNQSNARVYYNKVYIRKKLLFLIDMNITLFEGKLESRPAYLPLDSSPGGKQDMKNWGDLPFKIKESLFSFVPVYSALDVGGGQEPITYNDAFKAYSPVSQYPFPKNVRAANFMSNPTEGGIANELHCQITKRNATFLFEEMIGLEPLFTCGYTCNNPTLDFGIAGTNTICNGTATFDLVNASGLTPLWFKSENLNYVSGQSTDRYTVSSAANGQGWIKARVQSSCGMVEQTLYLQVGAITNADYSINAPASGCAYQPITFRATSLAGATYDWYWPNDWIYVSGQYGNTLTLQAPLNAQNVEVGVYMANACGPAGLPATFYVSSEDCGTYALAFFPNPTSSRLSIELQEDNLTEKQIQEVEILDAAGAPIKKWRGQSKKAELDVSNLPKGFCYARVNVGGKVTTARIQIK